MELTIEQALQQGAAAYKEGKIQDAERLYQSILQSQPAHPDANHNLGLIALYVNKPGLALALFKTALEANPKIEEFWLSYIDALIKEKQFYNAKQVLKQEKKQGVVEEKLNVLKAQLTSINEPEKVVSLSPSQEQLSTLLEHYQNRRFNDAEKLAISITHEFPRHNFSWKVLGAVFKTTGRNSEALFAGQKTIEISPDDADAHYNLGNTFKKLGRLDEAEVSFKQAIAMKPDFAGAYSNLGVTLQELGRLEEAEVSYTQAIVLEPDIAEAHNNLGSTLQKLARLNEAEASYRKAIALKPDYAQAHNNLGMTLQELGILKEAEASLRQAIVLKPDYAGAHNNLGNTLRKLGKLYEAEASYTQAIVLKPDYTEAHNSLLRCLYLLDKQSLFFKKLDYLIKEDIANATIGSLTCRSALKYGVEKLNLFCREPLKYVLHIDMNTRYDLEEISVEKARLILNEKKISNRQQALLVNGYQTSGNIFDIKNSFTEQIQKAIRLEIEKYRINFKNSQDGLIKKWPNDYSLHGWLITMKSGGELKPHIHNNGWLSGSLYINVPPKSKADSGNLVVSLGEETDATDARTNVEKIINVVTGSLVLFPASLTHYTIPFEAEEERIVLAFDVKQK